MNISYNEPKTLDELQDTIVPSVLNEIHGEVFDETCRNVEAQLNMLFWQLKMQGYQLIKQP